MASRRRRLPTGLFLFFCLISRILVLSSKWKNEKLCEYSWWWLIIIIIIIIKMKYGDVVWWWWWWCRCRTRQHMIADLGKGSLNEQLLFHGTQSMYVDGICKEGFDWRMCGVNGTAYGQGGWRLIVRKFLRGIVDCREGGNQIIKQLNLTKATKKTPENSNKKTWILFTGEIIHNFLPPKKTFKKDDYNNNKSCCILFMRDLCQLNCHT